MSHLNHTTCAPPWLDCVSHVITHMHSLQHSLFLWVWVDSPSVRCSEAVKTKHLAGHVHIQTQKVKVQRGANDQQDLWVSFQLKGDFLPLHCASTQFDPAMPGGYLYWFYCIVSIRFKCLKKEIWHLTKVLKTQQENMVDIFLFVSLTVSQTSTYWDMCFLTAAQQQIILSFLP